MCKIALTAAVCGFLLDFVASSSICHTFKGVSVTWSENKGASFHETINVGGCLESTDIDKQLVRVEGQNISTLARHSVRNLLNLTYFQVWSCKVRVIETELFMNVPHLQRIFFDNNNISKLPTNVFAELPQLQQLIMYNNNIVTIEKNAFSNNPALVQVSFTQNLLKNWDSQWFTNTTNVEILDFDRNKITALPEKAFCNLKKLKKINFNFNEIRKIYPNTFEGLKNLQSLRLDNNRLRVLEANSFPDPLVVKVLNIRGNYLNFLSERLMNMVTPSMLYIDGNPWNCFCLDRILDWVLIRSKGEIDVVTNCDEIMPICAYPDTNSRNCIQEVDMDVSDAYFHELHQLNSLCALNYRN